MLRKKSTNPGVAKRRAAREKSEQATKTAPLGEGSRFAALEESIAARGKVRNPAAVAAYVGRKKYGSKKFAELSAKGRKGK